MVVLFIAGLSRPSAAQVVGIALDPKAELVTGDVKVLPSPPPDSVVFLEFTGAKSRTLGRVAAPTSFQGPPSAVAVSADRTLALVTAFTQVDPQNPKAFAADNRLSVIDLTTMPIRVVQTLELGASPSSIAMNRTGTTALAMHSADDSVTVLSLANRRATIIEKRFLGKGSAPSAAAFAPDGHTVLMSLADRVAVFAVDAGRLVTPPLREMSAGIHPTVVAYCGTTGLAVVGNYGRVTGDADTVSLIDVASVPARVVDTASVGPSPEGVACSPDGRYAAAAIQNMATVARSHPLYAPTSMVVLLSRRQAPPAGGRRPVRTVGAGRRLPRRLAHVVRAERVEPRAVPVPYRRQRAEGRGAADRVQGRRAGVLRDCGPMSFRTHS